MSIGTLVNEEESRGRIFEGWTRAADLACISFFVIEHGKHLKLLGMVGMHIILACSFIGEACTTRPENSYFC